MAHSISIRPESDTDEPHISRVVQAAFARDKEAQLVDLIRARKQALLSLVAVADHEIVGHVLVSPISIDGLRSESWGGVAPLSVLPTIQSQGVGALLMNNAIGLARKTGLSALFLLGDPNYYTRFGFKKSHLASEYGATDAFMHLELEAGSLSKAHGTAKYVDAFSEVGA